MVTSSRALAVVLVLAIPSLGACKKKVGDACTTNQMACVDKTLALVCSDGKFAALGCRGEGRGKASGNEVAYDDRVASVGDACRDGDLACTTDQKGELACKDKKFVVSSSCRGAKGCAFQATTLYCDTDLAEPNDPCDANNTNNVACSGDHQAELRCKAGAFVLEGTCRGPKGCSMTGAVVHCDNNLADVGDACKEGDFACSMDKKAVLTCVGEKFVEKEPCKSGGCTYSERGSEVKFECR